MGPINFKFNDLAEAQSLSDVVEQKFAALERFLADGAAVTCDVEFVKVAARQSGAVHKVEANLMVDGTLFRAEATEESFEKAVDEVRDELDKELRRAKTKQETKEKQAGRDFKEQMLGQ
jgi:ribosomal subunit interface protein